MITSCICYTLAPLRINDFEEYTRRWPPIAARCGGDLVGYFLSKEGANNFTLARVDFETPDGCEKYRKRLGQDERQWPTLRPRKKPSASSSRIGRFWSASDRWPSSTRWSAGSLRVLRLSWWSPANSPSCLPARSSPRRSTRSLKDDES